MANDRTQPKVWANGAGNWPDATGWNDNFEKLNDMFYISATAPTSPYEGQMWWKTGVPFLSRLRAWDSDISKWRAVFMNGAIVS